MAAGEYFRGGASLVPSRRELKFDPATGEVLPARGVSVSCRPDGLDQFGGPHRVSDVPQELEIRRVGRNPNHYEIIPVRPMSYGDYLDALKKIKLDAV